MIGRPLNRIRYFRWRHNPGMIAAVRRQPPFFSTVIADTRFAAAHWQRPVRTKSALSTLGSALRLAWETDAFGSQIAYRARCRLLGLGVPLIPGLLHRYCMIRAQISIGEAVLMRPGSFITHGQVTIGGATEIGPRVLISPFVSIGLVSGSYDGPKIGAGVHIGTGSRILGPVTIGARARIGANAVVLESVPAEAAAVGVPARVVGDGGEPAASGG